MTPTDTQQRRERSLFIDGPDARPLYVFEHAPADQPRATVVFCHPLFEERLHCYRILVNLARRLADGGLRVVRFDYAGDGDSGGVATDLRSRTADIGAVVDWAAVDGPRPDTLLSVRLGAALALAAAPAADVEKLVLIDPVLDVEPFLHEHLRRNLAWQMAVHRKIVEDRDAMRARLAAGERVNVEGYDLTEADFIQGAELTAGLPAILPGLDLLCCAVGRPPSAATTELLEQARSCDQRRYRVKPFYNPLQLVYPDYGELCEDVARHLMGEGDHD